MYNKINKIKKSFIKKITIKTFIMKFKINNNS